MDRDDLDKYQRPPRFAGLLEAVKRREQARIKAEPQPAQKEQQQEQQEQEAFQRRINSPEINPS